MLNKLETALINVLKACTPSHVFTSLANSVLLFQDTSDTLSRPHPINQPHNCYFKILELTPNLSFLLQGT